MHTHALAVDDVCADFIFFQVFLGLLLLGGLWFNFHFPLHTRRRKSALSCSCFCSFIIALDFLSPAFASASFPSRPARQPPTCHEVFGVDECWHWDRLAMACDPPFDPHRDDYTCTLKLCFCHCNGVASSSRLSYCFSFLGTRKNSPSFSAGSHPSPCCVHRTALVKGFGVLPAAHSLHAHSLPA